MRPFPKETSVFFNGLAHCRHVLAILLCLPFILLFLASISISIAHAASMGTKAEMFIAPNVADSWRTVTFENTYSNPIPVCTYTLQDKFQQPATVRITNITSTSMQVRAQKFGIPGSTTPDDVHCLIMEAGAHTLPDGTKYFAGSTYTSNTHGQYATSRWNVSAQVDVSASIPTTLSSPVMLASIMSFNDSRPSAPYVTDCDLPGNSAFDAGVSDGACVGLHVGMDSANRTGETIGYIAIESGVSTFANVSFRVGMTPDAVVGSDTNTPYAMNVGQHYENAVLTQNAMDGGQGGWAVLRGTDPTAGNFIDMSIDEDRLRSQTNGRSHTTEEVAYFASTITPPTIAITATPDLTWVAESREITYTVTVENTGSGNISYFDLEADFPEGSTTTITSPDAAINDGTPNVLAPGEIWTYTTTFTPTQAYVNANTGNNIDGVFTAMGISGTATTYIIAPSPQVSVMKYADKTTNVAVGETITYSIYVSNNGNVTLHDITLDDVSNGHGNDPVPTSEVVYQDNNIANDSTDSTIDGKWDRLGYGDTVKFTSTYVVTQQDIETLQ